MAKTISANRGPITLNTPIYNPLTILSGVNISAPISQGNRVNEYVTNG